MDDETQFCIYTLISLSQADIEELVVPEAREKIFPITGAYKWSIYIFQACEISIMIFKILNHIQ